MTHHFRHNPHIPADYKNRRWCMCGRLETNPAHDMPPPPEADPAADIAAIRAGDTHED